MLYLTNFLFYKGINCWASVNQIKKLLNTGQWNEAIKFFKISPDASSATFLISHANKIMGNLTSAFEIYNILKNSKNPQFNCYLFTSLAYACQRLNAGVPQVALLWHDLQQFRF